MNVRPRVTVKVGVQTPSSAENQRSRVVLLGVLSEDAPWPSDRLPRSIVKRTRDNGTVGAEHLRIPTGTDLSALPGLAGSAPSRLRDAAQLIFRAGVSFVDVVVARQPGRRPFDLWQDETVRLLEPFVDQLPGTAIVVPDATGPARVDRRRVMSEARMLNLSAVIRRWKGHFAANYQLGFFDLPYAAERQMAQTVAGIGPGDYCLAAWEGFSQDLMRHGWRNASALAAGIAVRDVDPSKPIEGVVVDLPGGRRTEQARWGELGVPEVIGQVPDPLVPYTMRVTVAPGGDRAQLATTPTLRAPRGGWDVTLIRTAKMIHQRIVTASDAFVFRTATADQAIALSTALRMAVEPFVERSIVRGPGDRDEPEIVAFAAPDPAQPALVAQVGVFLVPWLRSLQFNVAVRPGEPPRLEVL